VAIASSGATAAGGSAAAAAASISFAGAYCFALQQRASTIG